MGQTAVHLVVTVHMTFVPRREEEEREEVDRMYRKEWRGGEGGRNGGGRKEGGRGRLEPGFKHVVISVLTG